MKHDTFNMIICLQLTQGYQIWQVTKVMDMHHVHKE